MSLEKRREAVAAKASAIAGKAKDEDRAFSAEELAQIKGYVDEIKDLDEKIKAAHDVESLLGSIAPQSKQKGDEAAAASLGAHYVKYAMAKLKSAKGSRYSVDAPEFSAKAAGDVHMTSTTGHGFLIPDIDRTIVHAYQERLFVSDWLGAGEMTSNALTYFVEKPDTAIEGDFTTVAEGARKPGITMPAYDPVTETLKKIAGWIKISDEMLEDEAFLVTEINNRLLFRLRLFEERQLLSGDGKGTNVVGLLNRSGLLTETAKNAADNADALYRAVTKIALATGLTADGIAINPIDYQALRLSKDANGQYFAGGPFAGPYGNGALTLDVPIWGKTVIQSSEVPAGTAIVGAGKQAATVYRKGGIRVESTNSNEDDFLNNRSVIRAEERVSLAVRVPSAFAKVTLASAAAA